MKKSILFLSVISIMAGISLSSCETSAEKEAKAKLKVEAAKSELGDAKRDLNQAQAETNADYVIFRKEAEDRIAAHEKSIAEFKARIASEKNVSKAAYEKELAELEQKNSDMKKKLDEFKAEGKDKWEDFKIEFSSDMDKLGEAFKNLTVNNVR